MLNILIFINRFKRDLKRRQRELKREDQIPNKEILTNLVVGTLDAVLRKNRAMPLNFMDRDCFIAGGAVGNIILSHVFNLELPINDIDVFVDESIYSGDDVDEDKEDEYLNVFCPEANSQFKIVSAKRAGIINTVITKAIPEHSRERYVDLVLSSFDFNCVEAGIYRNKHGEWTLFTSKAFDQLLSTKEVSITKLSHPFRTFIRLAKKKTELTGLYFKRHDDLRILQVLAHGRAQSASKITIDKFLKHVAPSYRGIFSFKPSDNGFFKVITNKSHALIYDLNTKERRALGRSTSLILQAVESLYSFTNPQKQRTKKISGYWRIFAAAIKSNLVACIQKESTREELKNAELFLGLAPNALSNGLNVGLDFNSLITLLSKAYLFISKEKKLNNRQFKSGFVGVIESHLLDLMTDKVSFKILLEQFFSSNLELHKPLIEGAPISTQFQDFEIRELITEYQLRIEGTDQSHCVGGYAPKIASGLCRIFSLKDSEGTRSTLEVNVSLGVAKAFVTQHRGRFNGSVSSEHRKGAEKIIRNLRKLGRALDIESSPMMEEVISF